MIDPLFEETHGSPNIEETRKQRQKRSFNSLEATLSALWRNGGQGVLVGRNWKREFHCADMPPQLVSEVY
jgi:hypothetical protein